MNIIKKLIKSRKETYPPLSTEGQIWNKFIEELCNKDLADLTDFQKSVVMIFQYDANVIMNGHSGFFECYPHIETEEIVKSLSAIDAGMYIDNFKEASRRGEWDDHIDTDNAFYSIQPSLGNILMEYVALHADKLGIK